MAVGGSGHNYLSTPMRGESKMTGQLHVKPEAIGRRPRLGVNGKLWPDPPTIGIGIIAQGRCAEFCDIKVPLYTKALQGHCTLNDKIDTQIKTD